MKNLFPNLQAHSDFVFLDSSATAQKPAEVIEAEKSFNENFYSTVARGNCNLSENSTKIYQESKEKIAKFFGTNSKKIALTSGATESLNQITFGLKKLLKKGDKVLVSILEHNSNLLPWFRLREEIGIEIVFVEPNENGEIGLPEIKKVFEKQNPLNPPYGSKGDPPGQIKICSLFHVSNLTGQVLNVEEIGNFLKEKGVLFFLDACQSAPHFPLNLDFLPIDGVFISAHKLGGPTGVGLLYLQKNLIEKFEPLLIGGGSPSLVSRENFSLISGMEKYEAGTQKVSQAVGFAAACDFLSKVGFAKIQEKEKKLLSYALENFKKFPVKILGNPKERVSLISFTVDGVHPHDLGHIFGENKICLRTGLHCADLAHEFFGVGASSRISFWLYNEKEDLDKFFSVLEEVLKVFKND